ncbi:MAG: hypothetical protein M3Z41_02835 [Candidatus Eremiobacteraeota bacterium]|nr:hypothetical protein [Candidatus Eremiobacteraeota bacterium]
MGFQYGLRPRFVLLLAAALVAIFGSLRPLDADAQLKIGLETLYLSGTHFETHASIREAFVAPILHVSLASRRLEFQAEGIPTVGITSSGSSPSFGSITTKVGFIDSAVRFAVDSNARLWLGLGGIVINQRTQYLHSTDPFLYQTESSRVSGPRYEAQIRLPLRSNALIVGFAGTPNLYGTVFFENCQLCFFKSLHAPEKGAMTDVTGMFETQHAHSSWDIGFRFINYSAVYPQYHILADRNVGGGLSLRYSYSFGQ